MQKKLLVCISLITAILLVQYSCNQPDPKTTDENPAPAPGNNAMGTSLNPDNAPFPDFGFMLSPREADSMGIRVFRLSQNYPDKLPDATLPDFFKIDFKKDWKQYLQAVQKYCFEGNTDVDFRVEDNKARSWYHMPWQHYSSNGREGFHGLTKEAPVHKYQLAPTQDDSTSGAWAIGFFNDVAGYTIGQVWKEHNNPNPAAMGSGFKNGAVLFKILFLSMPKEKAEKQVPFLQNGQWWDAYATYKFSSNERTPIKVALIQMDIMVRDDRAPNGWVFGNFQYNGKMNKSNKWENLMPVGIMWGQDPTNNVNQSNSAPKRTIINTKLTETIINPDTTELPPTHLGWNGRLNGPVDNPMSSCYSCHATAEYPAGSPLNPLFDADSAKFVPKPTDSIASMSWMRWFQNTKCGTPFDGPSYQSTDFCLQMAESIQNFMTWKNSGDALYYTEYGKKKDKAKAAAPAPTEKPRKVFSLGRRNI